MSGLFVTEAPVSDPNLRPVERPPSWLEAAGANWRLAKDDDEAENLGNLERAYSSTEDALVGLGYARDRYHRPEMRSFLDPVGADHLRRDAIWRDVQAARVRDPKHFADVPKTREEFERWGYRRQGQRDKDLAIAERGGFGTSIVPNLGFGVLTLGQPQNLPYLAIGGGSPTLGGLMAREFLTNSIGAATNAPTIARSREKMGETYDDADLDVLLAGGAGSLFAGGLHVGGKVIDHVTPDRGVVEAFDQVVPADLRTPDERAAIHVIERQADIDATNPYVAGPAGMDAHAQQLQATIENILSAGDGRAAPVVMQPAVIGLDGVKARIGQAESGGSYTAANPQPGQSAFGKYQFIDSTWRAIGKRIDPAATDAQIMAMRADPAAQERFMDAALAEYQATYARAGIDATPGDLYLMHALGPKAVKIARADPSTPIGELVSSAEMKANPTWLKGTASDVRAEFARRTGGDPGQRLISGPLSEGEDLQLSTVPERQPIVIPPVREDLLSASPFKDFPDQVGFDTRGAGVQYHGARGEVGEFTGDYYNAANIYGGLNTFYTTDAVDIANGYASRDGARLYQVAETGPVKTFDMEAIRSPEEWREFFRTGDDGLVAQAIEDAAGEHGAPNLRQVMDAIRAQDPASTSVLDAFDHVVNTLREDGYGAMSHVGGLLTGHKPHNVKIYFDPASQIGLADVTHNAPDSFAVRADASREAAPENSVADLQGSFSLPDERAGTAFDDPAGEGGKIVADSLVHDIIADLPPEVLEGGGPTFRLGEGDERTLSEILDEIATDEAAIAAARACL